MKMKKLSVKALMSLILSAILFVCRLGHFLQTGQILWRFMQRIPQSRKQKVQETVQKAQLHPVIGREENSEKSRSREGKTENSTEGTTEETQPAAKCTCKEKCSQYAVDEGL